MAVSEWLLAGVTMLVMAGSTAAQYQGRPTGILAPDRCGTWDTPHHRRQGDTYIADRKCSDRQALVRRPGQPTVDMTHTKPVYAKCSNPTTYTSLTSPVFNTYLADLGATFDGATPILLSAT